MPITMKVEAPAGGDSRYTLRLVERDGQTDAAIEALLLGIHERVNPAVGHDPAGAVFAALFKDGPVLFNVATVDERTQRTGERLAGLKVSADRLPATLAVLKELGFAIQQ
ncbi:MAG TPA: hypothetical protein PKE27_06110 [Povalibacter sp.]|uniref:hypothetical protein n=1 Tax=Povalibacter sp. TaxID=1962978 RepID=UPI002CF51C09|nr:hypothetical protein [Povalibacter sp.]HMN44122.1 hypothetical protein [Povalibacter sp.]